MLSQIFTKDRLFNSIDDVEKELNYFQLFDYCDGNPDNFVIWKHSEGDNHYFCVRCRSCKQLGKSNCDGVYPWIDDIENDNSGEKYKLFPYSKGSACQNCGEEAIYKHDLSNLSLGRDVLIIYYGDYILTRCAKIIKGYRDH